MRTSNLKWHTFQTSAYTLNLLDRHLERPGDQLQGAK